MEHETAGDPTTGLKWTKKTTRKIADELALPGIKAGRDTVSGLLKEMNYSLRVSHKKNSNGGKKLTPKEKRDRNEQFVHIGELRRNFSDRGFAVISVDSKKKEPAGNFKNPGVARSDREECVNDHDFPCYAVGKGVPFSIYDIGANRGTVFVGTTRDTPTFAVDCVEKWWETEGCIRYPDTSEILILADSGGSSSSRSGVWKYDIQEKICNRHGLSVTVCHYPPGASEWNPAEHRLHSEISKNWAGKPLTSYETMLKYIRTTKTSAGLKVNAHYVRKHCKLGRKITDRQMNSVSIVRHEIFPKWNYTIKPR